MYQSVPLFQVRDLRDSDIRGMKQQFEKQMADVRDDLDRARYELQTTKEQKESEVKTTAKNKKSWPEKAFYVF